jgi:hypothetical protein
LTWPNAWRMAVVRLVRAPFAPPWRNACETVTDRSDRQPPPRVHTKPVPPSRYPRHT